MNAYPSHDHSLRQLLVPSPHELNGQSHGQRLQIDAGAPGFVGQPHFASVPSPAKSDNKTLRKKNAQNACSPCKRTHLRCDGKVHPRVIISLRPAATLTKFSTSMTQMMERCSDLVRDVNFEVNSEHSLRSQDPLHDRNGLHQSFYTAAPSYDRYGLHQSFESAVPSYDRYGLYQPFETAHVTGSHILSTRPEGQLSFSESTNIIHAQAFDTTAQLPDEGCEYLSHYDPHLTFLSQGGGTQVERTIDATTSLPYYEMPQESYRPGWMESPLAQSDPSQTLPSGSSTRGHGEQRSRISIQSLMDD
ncbi:hypothetical protein QQS21_012785 [Conoideocrella luteorostrata]|uniref:Zn(2)-C6 fungal-type domain-containing protein n=1 Tax=Conoideocrella luteorostrata TaxID=1105319 RepID=A0AAJ0CAI8_9HYPO|nr:hypothetical protein QQS21_012785 [Conoideocrella luteorostrata]